MPDPKKKEYRYQKKQAKRKTKPEMVPHEGGYMTLRERPTTRKERKEAVKEVKRKYKNSL